MAAPADRFWQKVEKQPGEACWLWTASTVKGYGRISVGGRMVSAHRLAWELTYGPIPVGIDVLHSCDNPPCVRPSHLFLGTNDDNVADRMEKGRQARGVTHSRAVLTDRTVLEIRRLHAEEGLGSRRLARMFSVHRNTIKPILSGSTWKHIAV